MIPSGPIEFELSQSGSASEQIESAASLTLNYHVCL